MHTASTTQPVWNDSVSITVCTVHDRTKKYNQTVWIFSFFSLLSLSLSPKLNRLLYRLWKYQRFKGQPFLGWKRPCFFYGDTKIGGLTIKHLGTTIKKKTALTVASSWSSKQISLSSELHRMRWKKPAIRGPPSHGFSGDPPAFSPGELMVYWYLSIPSPE